MLQRTKTQFLSGTALKTIALVLMLLDHIHYFFEFTERVPLWFTMIGRLAAPLFLFCMVEGFAHTHDRRRYFLRILLIGAGMGGLEFFMIYGGMLRRGDGFFPLNAIFLGFALLCVLWQGIDWLRAKKWLPGLAALLLPIVWPIVAGRLSALPGFATPVGLLCYTLLPAWSLITDGGWAFWVGGLLLYLLRDHRKIQISAWVIWTLLTDFLLVFLSASATVPDFTFTMMFTRFFEWYAILAAPLMLCYNGQRGSGHKALFYCFYPAHVYILYILSCLLYNAVH